MLIALILNAIFTILILVAYGYVIRRKTILLMKVDLLRYLSKRMRAYADELPDGNSPEAEQPDLKMKYEIICARVDEMGEVAKWLEKV